MALALLGRVHQLLWGFVDHLELRCSGLSTAEGVLGEVDGRQEERLAERAYRHPRCTMWRIAVVRKSVSGYRGFCQREGTACVSLCYTSMD